MVDKMTEITTYNTDINDCVIDEVMREVLEGLNDEAKDHLEEFGFRLKRLKEVRMNIELLQGMNISSGSNSVEKKAELAKSLTRELEFATIHILITKVANSLIIFSEDGLGE